MSIKIDEYHTLLEQHIEKEKNIYYFSLMLFCTNPNGKNNHKNDIGLRTVYHSTKTKCLNIVFRCDNCDEFIKISPDPGPDKIIEYYSVKENNK